MSNSILSKSLAFVAMICLAIIGSTLAQPPLPIPSSLQLRASTELLIGGDFENDTDNNKIPDGWTSVSTSLAKSDKRKCDQPGSPVAYGGSCAFMFRGNPSGVVSKIQQTITDTSAIVDGLYVTFSVYLDARSGVPNTKIGIAKIVYSDGTSTKFTLTIPSVRGAADYQLVSDTHTISLPTGVTITKVKVDFRYGGKTGKFLMDDASFAVSATGETATATAAGSTSTPPPTPTDTATSTTTPASPLLRSNCWQMMGKGMRNLGTLLPLMVILLWLERIRRTTF